VLPAKAADTRKLAQDRDGAHADRSSDSEEWKARAKQRPDDVLSNAILQVLGDNARSQIDAAAGGIRHDNSDCLVGECLRMRRCGDGDDSEQSNHWPAGSIVTPFIWATA
jgi:hypothetical protein